MFEEILIADTAKSYLVRYGVLKEKRKIVSKSNESEKVKQKSVSIS